MSFMMRECLFTTCSGCVNSDRKYFKKINKWNVWDLFGMFFNYFRYYLLYF